MAGSARRIVVEFLGKDTSLGKTAADADSKTSKLGDTFKKVGKAAALGLGVGVALAGKALFDMTKGAIEDEKAQALLANTLRKTTGATDGQVKSVEEWISKQGVAKGVTDDELRPALQRLVEATGDVGEAQKLATLAMDVSAGSGKSLKTVSEALMKAQNGQVSGLSRLGIETKNAAGETLTFEQATKKMGETFGGAASTQANTLEGKMGRLKLIFDETKETIGAKLIPVVTKLADWFLNNLLPGLSFVGAYIQVNLVPIFKRVGEVVSDVLSGMRGDTSGNLGKIREIIANVASVIQALWARFGDSLISNMRAAWSAIKAVISGALQIINGIFKVFSGLLRGDWDKVWDGLRDIVRGAWTAIQGVVRAAGTVLRNYLRELGDIFGDTFRNAWANVREIVANGIDRVMDGIRSIPDRIRGLGDSFRAAGRWIIDAMVDGLKNAAGVVAGIAGNVWNAVRGMLNGAISQINAALEFRIALPGKDIVINPPNIPHLATGGVVRARPGGVLALLGEGGHDEAVVPLSGPHAPRGGPSGGTVINVTVNGALDPNAVARQIQTILLKYKRKSGQSLGLT